MERGFTLGVMEENMKEIGEITKCMVKEYLPGQTEENMQASMLMIRNKDMENLFGQMVDLIKGIGYQANNMVKEGM